LRHVALEQRVAARLVDRAQRLGECVVARAIGGGDARGIARRDEVRERRRIQERQVARQHQPRALRVARLRGRDPGNGTDVRERVLDLRKTRPRPARSTAGPNRDVGARHQRRQQRHGALELRAAGVVQRGLVLAHAGAAAAGEHQAIERGGHMLSGRAGAETRAGRRTSRAGARR
jgi:hypothetical protein